MQSGDFNYPNKFCRFKNTVKIFLVCRKAYPLMAPPQNSQQPFSSVVVVAPQ